MEIKKQKKKEGAKNDNSSCAPTRVYVAVEASLWKLGVTVLSLRLCRGALCVFDARFPFILCAGRGWGWDRGCNYQTRTHRFFDR